MQIEQILYINLDSRPDRNEGFIEYMETLNGGEIPYMERFSAHDGRDYESVESMIEHALRDGVSELSDYAGSCYKGSFGGIWSYTECLRRCVETGKTTLILYDDLPLGSPISELNTILQAIAEKDEHDFRILQLSWHIPKHYPKYFRQIIKPEPVWYLPDYCHGFSGHGDQRNIYSPKGAQWMLNAMTLAPLGFEEITGSFFCMQYFLPGIFSSQYRDNCWTHFLQIPNETQDRLVIDEEDRRRIEG